jgi:hypothetical protein
MAAFGFGGPYASIAAFFAGFSATLSNRLAGFRDTRFVEQREGFRRGRLLLSARIKEGNGHFLLLRGRRRNRKIL